MHTKIHTPSRPRKCVSAVALVLSLTLLFTGCTSLQSVPLTGPSALTAYIHPGDFVQAQTKDGQSQSFKVTALESDALVGRNVHIKYADLATLQVRRIDNTKTTWVVILGVVVVLLAATALIQVSTVAIGPI